MPQSVAPHPDSVFKPKGRYHHGNLRAALIRAATTLLVDHGVAGLSLRGAARMAGVSQTAPYRHFKDREALLAAVAAQGFHRLIDEIDQASGRSLDSPEDAVVAIGAAYIRFATEHAALFRLMFGRDIENRRAHEDLVEAMDDVADVIGRILKNPALGIGIWAAMHGLAFLLIEDVAHLGDNAGVIPGRAEIVLRSLLAHLVDA